MSQTTTITITHDKPAAELGSGRLSGIPSGNSREACLRAAEILTRIAAGMEPASVAIATTSVATQAATGTVTLSTGLAAAEKVTIEGHDFTARAKYATGVATITTAVATNVVTLNGIAFTAVANGATPTGNQWAVGTGGTADADSATALAAAITAATATCLCTAAAVGAAVTITANAAGATGNLVTCVRTGTPIALTGLSSGKLSGAYSTALDEWPVETTLALSALALAAAVNRSATAGVTGVVTANAAAAVVTVSAVARGTGGNSLTHAKTGSHVAVSGSGTLAGGAGGAAVTTTYGRS